MHVCVHDQGMQDIIPGATLAYVRAKDGSIQLLSIVLLQGPITPIYTTLWKELRS